MNDISLFLDVYGKKGFKNTTFLKVWNPCVFRQLHYITSNAVARSAQLKKSHWMKSIEKRRCAIFPVKGFPLAARHSLGPTPGNFQEAMNTIWFWTGFAHFCFNWWKSPTGWRCDFCFLHSLLVFSSKHIGHFIYIWRCGQCINKKLPL